jgi:hypothetical protein
MKPLPAEIARLELEQRLQPGMAAAQHGTISNQTWADKAPTTRNLLQLLADTAGVSQSARLWNELTGYKSVVDKPQGFGGHADHYAGVGADVLETMLAAADWTGAAPFIAKGAKYAGKSVLDELANPESYSRLMMADQTGALTFKGKPKVLEATAEDFELNPARMEDVVGIANMDATTGKIYPAKPGENGVFNHADVAIQNNMDFDNTITGFVDKDGEFVFQYKEDVEKIIPQKNPPPRYTAYELQEMDIEDLDVMAFGVKSGEVKEIAPQDIKIKYDGDIECAEDKLQSGGRAWAESVDLSEPVLISVDENGAFILEDGHHRYVAAKATGRPLIAEFEVKGSPVRAILKRQGDL